MAAVSQSIPNLLGGVSQQPDPIKLPGQVREAVNAYLDPTFGCKKRPPTVFKKLLASNIPSNAKWFPILRDSREKYIVCIYRDPTLKVRVWDATTGTERTVTVASTASDYLSYTDINSLNYLSLADYTLISNSERIVSMSEDQSPNTIKEAFVSINAVAYNTNYSIDLNKDGSGASTVKVYSASQLEVTPGSYEVDDGGACSEQSSQDYTVTSGAKTGLAFKVVNQCSAYLKKVTEVKATAVSAIGTYESGAVSSSNPANWSGGPWPAANSTFTITKTGASSLVVRATYTAYSIYISRYVFGTGYRLSLSYVSGGEGWKAGDVFQLPSPYSWISGTVTTNSTTTTERYFSRYSVSVVLKNGGSGWRVGDTYTVTQGGKSFTVRVAAETFVYTYASDGTASHTTPLDSSTGILSIANIIASLQTAVNAISGYTSTSTGNVLRIRRTDSRDFNIGVRGGPTNQAMSVVKGTANDFAALPPQCFPDAVIKINNTENAEADDYYVKFVPDSQGIPGTGSWEETIAPGVKTNINPSTMPHALIRQADGTFRLDPLNSETALGGWAPRQVGDDTTNPVPSFVGKSIRNMLFYYNRLGFLSGDTAVLSQPGDYFNFFATSAITISDADPIDVTAASTQPAILKHAIGTGKGLIIFAEHAQFLLTSDEAQFGPSTVRMTEVANYSYRSVAAPQSTGVSIMFPTEADTYSKVFEIAVDSVDNRPVVAENTRIIPEYIPPSLAWSANSPNNNLVLFGDNSPTAYVFKYFNQGNERQIAGWAKWTFPGQVKLFSCDNDTNYIVLFDNANHVLVEMELLDDPDTAPLQTSFSKFTPRLDHICFKAALTITNEGSLKKVRFPAGSFMSGSKPVLMVTSGTDAGTFVQPFIQEDGSGYYILVDPSYTTSDFVIGLQYRMQVDLPSFYVTQDNRADRLDNPIVETIYLDLYYSGRYELEINRLGYDPFVYEATVARSDLYNANDIPVTEVFTKEIPVYCMGQDVRVSIYADDPVPSAITSYSWKGHYNKRGIAALR